METESKGCWQQGEARGGSGTTRTFWRCVKLLGFPSFAKALLKVAEDMFAVEMVF